MILAEPISGRSTSRQVTLSGPNLVPRLPTVEEQSQIDSCKPAWSINIDGVAPFNFQGPARCQKTNFEIPGEYRNFYRDGSIEKLYSKKSGKVVVVPNEPTWLQNGINWALDNCALIAAGAGVASGGTAAVGVSVACGVAGQAGITTGTPGIDTTSSATRFDAGVATRYRDPLAVVRPSQVVDWLNEPKFPVGSIAVMELMSGRYRIAVPPSAGKPRGLSGSGNYIEVSPPTSSKLPENVKLVSETEFDRKIGKLPWYKDWVYLAPIGAGTVILSAATLFFFRRKRR